MSRLEGFGFNVAQILIGLSLIFSLWRAFAGKTPGKGELKRSGLGTGFLALFAAGAGLLFLTLSIIGRISATGHAPFSNMYETSISIAWGIIAMGFYFYIRYRALALSTFANLIALGLMLFAGTLSSRPVPLVPALQMSFLLTVHVACAVIAYGAFTIGFVAAVLYLLKTRGILSSLPDADVLDEISYHSVIIAFPFLTLVIVLGAIWADVAWGRYWSWDPKETASLVTWLLYAGYLHARVLRGWRGNKTAVLLIIGFFAILLTFFGNYIFQGLHSYG